LLVAGLGGAYWASLPTPEASEEAVSVVSIDPKSVTEVRFKSKDIEAIATKRPNDSRFLITYTKTEVPPVNPHVPRDPKAPPPQPKTTTEHFLANDKLTELLKSYDPLYAVRVIEKIDDKQLADYGLKDSTDSFTIKSSGNRDFVLHIGKRSYSSRNRFTQDDSGKSKVLLIDDRHFEDLERASLRLFERRIINADVADISKVELSTEGRSKRIDHTARDKANELIWSDEEDAKAKPQAAYANFMDRVFKLNIAEYGEIADEQTLKDVKPFLTITFEKNGKAVDHVIFKKTGGDKPVYWVTSDFLQTYAKVQPVRMESIEKDLGSVLSQSPKS
jgi:hypothetical protein